MAMYSSTGSTHDVDWASLELMCLYIGEYRCFSETGINLNAKYCFGFQREEGSGAEWPTVQVSRNREHVDLFQEYGVNLKIICGINGVGKTSILELLRHNQHAPDDRYFVLFKDKNNKFLCTKEIPLLCEGKKVPLVREMSDVNLSNLTSSQMERKGEGLGILLNMASSYSANKELFDFDSSPLFTHFNVDVYAERENREVIERVLADEFGIKDDFALWSLWRDHPLIYCFLHFCQDNTFEAAREKIADEIGDIDELVAIFANGVYSAEYIKLHNKARAMFFKKVAAAPKSSAEFQEEIGKAMVRSVEQSKNEREPRYYPFSKYEEIRTRWSKLEDEVYAFFSKIFPEENRFHITVGIFEGLFYFRPVRSFRNGRVRELDDLSHGEFFTVITKYGLLPRMAQTDGIWFDDDEADNHLHPEWKRRFLLTYLEGIRETRSMLSDRYPNRGYEDKVYSIILTTHSPFLLSDVPSEHVVYMEPSESLTALGLPRTEVRSENLQSSFCGNIGEMFYSNFFMEETIGEFAKRKVEHALEELEKGVSKERMIEIESLFSKVGDSLLKNLLDEKVANTKAGYEKD